MPIEFPIEVKTVKHDGSEALRPALFGGKCGDFVSIRPCADEYENKTYLGIFLGDLARMASFAYDKKTGTVHVGMTAHNPAIFVPDLNKVIMGCESWWGQIRDEKSLREITDDDISNVWYVKALKAMTAADASPE